MPNDTYSEDEAFQEHEAIDLRLHNLECALTKALPVLEEHAEDERTFWGTEDKHGIAAEAEAIYAEAKAALGK